LEVKNMRKLITMGRAARVAALSAILALVVSAQAFATEEAPKYSVKPVTEGITSNVTENLPTILLVVGGLMALGIIIHLVRRFAKP
jgi:hypothetical protein